MERPRWTDKRQTEAWADRVARAAVLALVPVDSLAAACASSFQPASQAQAGGNCFHAKSHMASPSSGAPLPLRADILGV